MSRTRALSILALAASLLVPACRETRERLLPAPVDDARGELTVPASSPRSRRAAAADPAAPATADAQDVAGPWSSAEACRVALARGERMPRPEGVARIGTWNVRWFPDGVAGRRPKRPKPTDVDWLACAVAWLRVDVVALQEIKGHAEAKDALSRLVRELDGLTGGAWRVHLDGCPQGPIQHVALLWDGRRVRGEGLEDVASLNAHGAACEKLLRPGLAGYFRFPGGFDTHVVSVHAKSGAARRDIDLRARAADALGPAARDLAGRRSDEDVVFAGDFNTMGCRRCSPSIDAGAELAAFDAILARDGLRRVPAAGGCSEYFDGRGTLLDHVVVTRATREAEPGAKAVVSGYCGALACGPLGGRDAPAAYESLSDHCPVVTDFVDRDLD